MDAILTKLAEGAPIAVLLVLLVAWAGYKWPFLLMWNALREESSKREAMQERFIQAMNASTATGAANTEAIKAVTEYVRALPKQSQREG